MTTDDHRLRGTARRASPFAAAIARRRDGGSADDRSLVRSGAGEAGKELPGSW
jgi:hypothetical protein